MSTAQSIRDRNTREALNQVLVAARFAVGDAPADVIAVLVGAIAMTANRTSDPVETLAAARDATEIMRQKRSVR